MKASTLRWSIWGGLFALCVLVGPSTVAAQSEVNADQASEFMGTWVINLDSDFGAIALDLEITGEDGKVAVMVGAPEMGGMVNVTDITKEGTSLVLSYEADAEGQVFPVMIELEPDGQELSVEFEAADGQFFASGTATKG